MSTFPNGTSNAAAGPSGSALAVNPTDLNRLSPHAAAQPNGYAVQHAAPAKGTLTIVSEANGSTNGLVGGPQPNFLFGYRKTGVAYTGHMKLHWRPDLPEDKDSEASSQSDDEWEPERPARISAIWKRLRSEPKSSLRFEESIAERVLDDSEWAVGSGRAHRSTSSDERGDHAGA